jgi:hypothetical protein
MNTPFDSFLCQEHSDDFASEEQERIDTYEILHREILAEQFAKIREKLNEIRHEQLKLI